jgi:signal transduction histidine kinase
MVEEAHQGTIETASTYGVGTSFILHFPAVGP